VEYIWINSLFIIQDSKEDWGKESLLIETVYSNSFYNIAATAASYGTIGLFSKHDIPISHLNAITIFYSVLFLRRSKAPFQG
jgi:hypothetical protein